MVQQSPQTGGDGCVHDMEGSKGVGYRNCENRKCSEGRLEGAGLSEMGYRELRFGFGDET